MSYMHNVSWTPSEKVDLLVNVLRSSVPDLPLFLMQVLHEKGIYPKWNDTPLPAGRSLASSQIIYEEMGRPFKQQGPYNVQPIGVAHVPPIAPALPGRRTFPEFEPYPSQQQQALQSQQQQPQRTLQPRPPRSTDSPIPIVTNGEATNVVRTITMAEPAQEPYRKKRGRPSKEEAEERDRALAAEGKVYQPKKRPAKKMRTSLETPVSSRIGDAPPLVARTPPALTSEVGEEDFGEKRRLLQNSREEGVQSINPPEEHADSPRAGAQSPSDRLLAPHRERERDLDMLLTREVSQKPSEYTKKGEGH